MPNGLEQDISMGGNLQSLRKQVGLTQEQVSVKLELMGVSMTPEIFAKIEQGRYSIKLSVLLALKQIYQVDTFDVFFEGLSLPHPYE